MKNRSSTGLGQQLPININPITATAYHIQFKDAGSGVAGVVGAGAGVVGVTGAAGEGGAASGTAGSAGAVSAVGVGISDVEDVIGGVSTGKEGTICGVVVTMEYNN